VRRRFDSSFRTWKDDWHSAVRSEKTRRCRNLFSPIDVTVEMSVSVTSRSTLGSGLVATAWAKSLVRARTARIAALASNVITRSRKVIFVTIESAAFAAINPTSIRMLACIFECLRLLWRERHGAQHGSTTLTTSAAPPRGNSLHEIVFRSRVDARQQHSARVLTPGPRGLLCLRRRDDRLG